MIVIFVQYTPLHSSPLSAVDFILQKTAGKHFLCFSRMRGNKGKVQFMSLKTIKSYNLPWGFSEIYLLELFEKLFSLELLLFLYTLKLENDCCC